MARRWHQEICPFTDAEQLIAKDLSLVTRWRMLFHTENWKVLPCATGNDVLPKGQRHGLRWGSKINLFLGKVWRVLSDFWLRLMQKLTWKSCYQPTGTTCLFLAKDCVIYNIRVMNVVKIWPFEMTALYCPMKKKAFQMLGGLNILHSFLWKLFW